MYIYAHTYIPIHLYTHTHIHTYTLSCSYDITLVKKCHTHYCGQNILILMYVYSISLLSYLRVGKCGVGCRMMDYVGNMLMQFGVVLASENIYAYNTKT